MAEDAVRNIKVVAIGGSAGSLEVILDIVQHLPANPAAVFIIVVHRKNDKDSILQNLLSEKTALAVIEVEDKEMIVPNTIYLAPPGYHLLIENETIFSLDGSDKIHFSRPSIDVSFESIAEIFKERVIGILLSGSNADGAQGMAAIKSMGGCTIAQNPKTSEVGYMPQQAIELGCVDHILDNENILSTLMNELGKP
ncbi:MAG TPA: chemotaxis protein CheB [Flavitalea sp.]|nr:chemotaxis protein CheB [Flavitalea sp.]